MIHTSSICCVLLLAVAAEPTPPPTPFPLHPAAAPSPALKYTLLPELRDQAPGNAAERYRKAIKIMKQDGAPPRDWYPFLEDAMKAPLKEFPRGEAGDFLKSFETTFKEMDAAARCESCDWGLTEKAREQGFAVVLPDVQDCRSFAALLQLKARLEIAEGRYGDAVHTLQTGYALSRHVADAPTLICPLVGIAISQIMTGRLEELVQQPDAPNLYWALTDLPRPLIDLRKPMQGERLMIYGSFPGLAATAADPNAGPASEEQVAKWMELLGQLNDDGNQYLRIPRRVEMAIKLNAGYEAAKKQLVAEGRPQEKVDAMPHVQVGLLVAVSEYDRYLDDVNKLESLPYWESRPRLEEADARRKEAIAKGGAANAISRALAPATSKVFSARTRIDRRLAALRVVEALRLNAAAHDGTLPSALSEIKEVPVPVDPLTGKDFEYAGGRFRAVLSSSPWPGQTNAVFNPAYELLLNK
jgi:hypothetical protein